MKAQKFWMVWSPSGRTPTHKHGSRQSAFTEAERLARVHPLSTFFVLKAVGGVKARPIAVEPIDMITVEAGDDSDGIPF